MTTVQNSVPDEMRCDHLILLVGGNPLPNYVAARILGKQGGTVHLVHTQKTYRIAQRLAGQLKRPPENSQLAGEFKITFVQVSEDNPSDIFDKVKALAGQRDGRVGLNYTGGNRPMSVHAYSAVAAASRDPLFSYLDAGRLEMLVHDANRTLRRFRADLLLNMSLETLLRLQGLVNNNSNKDNNNDDDNNKLNKTGTTLLKPKLAAALAYLHSTDKGLSDWKNWRENGSDGWTKLPKNQPGLEKVEKVLEELCNGDPTPDKVAQLLGHSELRSTAKWWTSEWLENYTFDKLRSVIDGREDTQDARMGLRCKRIDHGNRDFELDIVVMRRYQLFVFSCIVSNDAQACKRHLTEAYVRARQAGGDEARVGLVCVYKDPEALQEEIASDLDAAGKIRVFGQEDLIPLADRIKEWLDNQP
jgi:hypothetical protein